MCNRNRNRRSLSRSPLSRWVLCAAGLLVVDPTMRGLLALLLCMPITGFMVPLHTVSVRKGHALTPHTAKFRSIPSNMGSQLRCSSVQNDKGQTTAQDRLAEQMRLIWELEGTVEKKDFAMGAQIQDK
jgi:hypothetical protein